MEIKGVVAFTLLKVSMRVDRKDLVTGLIAEQNQFTIFLPKRTAEKVKEGDYLEVLCIPDWTGCRSEKVFNVKMWIDGNGTGETIYTTSEYWQNKLSQTSPV
jgi:hypothetical protein